MMDPGHKRRVAIILALLGVAVIAGVSSILLYGPARTPVPADEPTAAQPASDPSVPDDERSPTTSAPPPEDATGAEDADNAPSPSAERVPAIVVSAEVDDDTTYLEVDYIQFLTGDEAAAAAAAHGDESPPPNDYYIVNENARLRRFAVQDGISVNVVVNDDGSSEPGGRTMPLSDWVVRLEGPAAEAFRAGFHWLTVSGETIMTIEQQYLP